MVDFYALREGELTLDDDLRPFDLPRLVQIVCAFYIRNSLLLEGMILSSTVSMPALQSVP